MTTADVTRWCDEEGEGPCECGECPWSAAGEMVELSSVGWDLYGVPVMVTAHKMTND